MFQLVLTAVTLSLLIFALIDVITADSSTFRYLDKVSWAFIVILFPLIGSILWLVLGKTHARSASPETGLLYPSPQDDADAVDREIEFHEREARIRRLEAELRAKRDDSGTSPAN